MVIISLWLAGTFTISYSISKTITSPGLELIGQGLLGYCSVVAAHGDYTYAGFGSAIVVLDTTDPGRPSELGRTFVSNCFDGKVGLWGDRLFVPRDIYGLGVFDVSRPDRPFHEATYCVPDPNGNDYSGSVQLAGGYAFWANGHKGLTILDADPSSPGYLEKVGGFDRDELDFALSVHVQGGMAYLCARSSGIYVLDVQDVTSPSFIERISAGFAADMTSSGQYGYLAEGPYGLKVIDLATNQIVTTYAPEGSNPLSLYYRSIVSYGSYLYVASGMRGVDVIDISSPTGPAFIQNIPTEHYSSQLSLSGDHLYVADCFGGLNIYSLLPNPEQPQHIKRFNDSDFALDVAILNDFAYIAYGRHGLAILDVSDPAAPSKEILYDIHSDEGTSTEGVFAAHGLLFVADGAEGLKVFEVSDPWEPGLLWTFSETVDVHDVQVIDHIAYLADHHHEHGGLWVVDVSGVEDPAFQPAFVEHLSGLGHADRVCKFGESVYVTSDLQTIGCMGVSTPDVNNGLCKVDLDTLEVEQCKRGEQYGYTSDVEVEEVGGVPYVFVTLGGGYSTLPGCLAPPESTFMILDAALEEEVGKAKIGGRYFADFLAAVEVVGERAFLNHPNVGICVYDISDITNPIEEERYKLTCNNNAYEIILFGDYFYDAHGDSGLYIFRYQEGP